MTMRLMAMSEFQTIELDCPPGAPRPGDLIRGVIGDLDIEPLKWDVTPFFGCAEWVFRIPRDRWESEYQPTIKERVSALYRSGVIRYGSW
jgi:hypothetical protein